MFYGGFGFTYNFILDIIFVNSTLQELEPAKVEKLNVLFVLNNYKMAIEQNIQFFNPLRALAPKRFGLQKYESL